MSLCYLIKRSGYCLYATVDAYGQLIRTPKGILLAREILACGLYQAQLFSRAYHTECQALNSLVATFQWKEPFSTQFLPTFLAYQGLMRALGGACAGARWNLARAVFHTTAKTLSLLDYFDKLGGHTIETLLVYDAKWGGLAARLGNTSFFRMCGMQTVSGLKNRLSILANLCAIAQAIQDYKRESTVPRHALKPKHVYAKRILAIQLSKEILKITVAVCVAGTPFATCASVALLTVNVAQELFNVYYIGTPAQPPRRVPVPRCLLYVQERDRREEERVLFH